jgi:hypothetical protein
MAWSGNRASHDEIPEVAMIDGFLIGVIVTASVGAGLFFLRFWRHTGDLLFLAFASAFMIEGLNRARFLALDVPAEGSASIYLVRLLAYLLILGAILHKNVARR